MVQARTPVHASIAEASRSQRDVFKAIGARTRKELLRVAKEEHLQKGGVLFSQGEKHRASYFILDGLIKTFYVSPQGKAMTLAHWSEGDMVGGPEFFADTTHVWSAAAMKDSVVLAIEGADLDRLVKRFPDLAQYVIRTLTFKSHWLSVLLQTRCTESVTDRLAHLLVILGEMYGIHSEKGVVIPKSFSQEELANMVGASRQWVNLTLGRLQRAHLIYNANRRIVLRDVEGLTQTGLIALSVGKEP